MQLYRRTRESQEIIDGALSRLYDHEVDNKVSMLGVLFPFTKLLDDRVSRRGNSDVHPNRCRQFVITGVIIGPVRAGALPSSYLRDDRMDLPVGTVPMLCIVTYLH